MTSGIDRVGKAVYRAILRSARRFDRHPASKALIHRFVIEGTGPDELSADQRIYAAGLEAFVGGRFAGPERIKWPLQRLVRSLSREDFVNGAAALRNGCKGEVPRTASAKGEKDPEGTTSNAAPGAEEERFAIPAHGGVDFAVQMTLAKFFPPDLPGVEGRDVRNAGFAALKELSSKWALAKTLSLDVESPKTWRKKGDKPLALPRRKKTTRTRLRRRLRADQSRRKGPSVAPSVPPPPPPPSPSPPPTSSSSPSPCVPRRSLSPQSRSVEPTHTPGKGVYLISHPLVGLGLDHPSSIFHRSVVLLVDHNDRLSYGLIVNKDRDVTLREVMSPGALPQASELMTCFTDNPVRTGGPVMPCFSWLHHHESVGGLPLSEPLLGQRQVFFCGRADKASELVGAGTTPATDFCLFMGASTWEGGMLNRELARGDWIMAQAPAELALAGGSDLWSEMLEAMGGEFLEMSRLPHAQRWADLGAQNRPSDLQL